MIKSYEIKPDGTLGEVREIDPSQGIERGWTYDPPPSLDIPHIWVDGGWRPQSVEMAGLISPQITHVNTTNSDYSDVILSSITATPVQLRRALRQVNWMPDVVAWLEAQSEDVRDVWEYSLEFKLTDPFILQMLEGIQKTEEDLYSAVQNTLK